MVGLVSSGNPDGEGEDWSPHRVVERYTYDPYGKVFIESWTPYGSNPNDGTMQVAAESNSGMPYSPLGNPFMFTGHRYDAAVGLYATWARTYSPTLGRWLQRDPLGYIDGVNLYEYVSSDPLGLVDPFGLLSQEEPPGDSDPFEEIDKAIDAAGTNSLGLGSVAASGGGANGTPPDAEFARRAGEAGIEIIITVVPTGRLIRVIGKLIPKAVGKAKGVVKKAIEGAKKLVGKKPCPKPKGIPIDWLKKPSKKGGGTQYVNPKNPHDRVRVMPGNPNSPNPHQRKPYVKRMKDGKALDKNGNPVSPDSPDAHIPIDEFEF